MFNGKSVFISGATGFFGRMFIRTLLARYQPRRVVVFSSDELKQYQMREDERRHTAKSRCASGSLPG